MVINCYYCGSAASKPWGAENGFTMVKCRRCGLLYVNPRPDEDAIALGTRTGTHEGDALLDTNYGRSPSRINALVDILNRLYEKPFLSQKTFSWLDVGCGYGEFIQALCVISGPNATIHGFDPNKEKIARFQSLDIGHAFTDARELGVQYDFLSLLNVYSHLPNPVEAIQGWRKLLKPGGEILLQTGDWKNLRKKDFPRNLNLPDHLSFATEHIVTSILRNLGFKILKVERVRCSAFKHYSVKYRIKDIIKLLVRRHHQLANWHRNPYRDMWIRARLQ